MLYITAIMEVLEMSEYDRDKFLSSGSNVQGIARLSFAVPLISGLVLLFLGWRMLTDYDFGSYFGWVLIILGVVIIVSGLVTFFLIKAFGDLVESNAHCEYYLKEIARANEKLAEYDKKCAYYLEKMSEKKDK